MEITQTGKGFDELFQAILLPLIITRASDGLIIYANLRFADVSKMSPETVVEPRTPDLFTPPIVSNGTVIGGGQVIWPIRFSLEGRNEKQCQTSWNTPLASYCLHSLREDS
jgi:hypothetical protein